MDRIRGILYEASIIFLAGVTITALGYAAWVFVHKPTTSGFLREYAVGDVVQQRAVAEKYLRVFPDAELLAAVEKQNAAEGCHIQGHGIGRAIYKQSSNFAEAIRMCGGSCTHGCFHGAMMEMFQTDSDTLGGVINETSPADVLMHIKRVAPDLCTRPEVASVVQPRYCTHGVGHAFAYLAGPDLEQAVRSCDVLGTRRAINPCVSGVFMEHLFSTSSAAVMMTKGPEPCDSFPGTETFCYRYKAYGWIHTWGEVQPALAACDSFGEFTMICVRSIAMAAARVWMLETEGGLNDLCGRLDEEKHRECVVGALLKIIDSNNGDDSDRLCDSVHVSYRNACLSVLKTYREGLASSD